MEDLGVIERIEQVTQWCAPRVIAKKKNNTLRIYVDYAELNKQIVRERFIMPTVEESLAKLGDAHVFSKLDGNSGYWQVPLAPASRELTAFITPVGRYIFCRIPFGIATAPEFFQREMLRILEGIPGQVCQMDNVLVFGKDKAEHDSRLRKGLRRLEDAGVTLNAEKCEFAKTRVKCLGHVLDAHGISADPEKTEAMTRMPASENVTELRSFLGMVNHLAKFLPGIAEKTKPLRDLLHGDVAWSGSPATSVPK